MCTTGLDRIARKRSFAWRSPLAEPQYLGLLSASIEKALEDSAFGSIRVFGRDEIEMNERARQRSNRRAHVAWGRQFASDMNSTCRTGALALDRL